MAYPGDQQQPGGWGPAQPPQSPYGPAEDQAGHGDSSFEPTYGSGVPHGAEAPPYGTDPRPYDAPSSYDQSAPYDDRPAGPYAGSAPHGQGAPYDQVPPYDAGPPGPAYGEPMGGHGAAPGGPDDGPYGYGYAAGPDGYEPDSPARSKKPLIIGAAVAAGVVVIGGGAALALSGGGGEEKPQAAPTTTAAAPPSPTAPGTPTPTETGKGQRLRSRTTDPKPLTLNEVFKSRRFKGGGRVYAMSVRRADRTCANGAHGTSFRRFLTKAGCTQVLRATFGNGKFVGTIGVFNLRSAAAATAARKAAQPKDAYVVPLPGAGTTKKLGTGLSLTTAEADGHYLILSWVQYPNGKKIARGDYSGVTAFVQHTTLGSNLRPALNYRSMEGKPA